MAVLNELKEGVLIFIVIIFLIAAGSLALNGLSDNVDKCTDSSAIFNTSYPGAECRNASLPSYNAVGGTTYAFNMTQNGNEGLLNTSEYMGTIGLMLAIAGILSIIGAAFYYYKK